MSYFPPIMARGMGKGSIEDLSCKTKKIKPNILVRTILKQIHVKKISDYKTQETDSYIQDVLLQIFSKLVS